MKELHKHKRVWTGRAGNARVSRYFKNTSKRSNSQIEYDLRNSFTKIQIKKLTALKLFALKKKQTDTYDDIISILLKR